MKKIPKWLAVIILILYSIIIFGAFITSIVDLKKNVSEGITDLIVTDMVIIALIALGSYYIYKWLIRNIKRKG